MAVSFDPYDYLKPMFDLVDNEVGYRVGIPILSHEIGKQPDDRIKWTDYDKIERLDLRLDSIGSGGIIVKTNVRRRQYYCIERPWPLSGRVCTKHSEVNCVIRGIAKARVSRRKIVADEPTILGSDCTASGWGPEALLDHMAHAMSFFVSGGRSRTGLFDILGGLGALGYNFVTVFGSKEINLTDEIEYPILRKLGGFCNDIHKYVDEGKLYLKSIKYEKKGIWFIYGYRDSFEDAVNIMFSKVAGIHRIEWKFGDGGAVYLNISTRINDVNPLGIPNVINMVNARVPNIGTRTVDLKIGRKYRVALVADNTADHPGRWAASKVIKVGIEGVTRFDSRGLKH